MRAALFVRVAACCAFVWASPAFAAADDAPVPVRVERVKPKKEKLPTLRFLRTNLEFVRGRLDLLRERPLAADGSARTLDPRFLRYGALVAAAQAASDSAAAIDRSVAGRELFARERAGRARRRARRLGRLLAEQQERLARLQADFAARPTTSLALLVSGVPAGGAPRGLAWVREDGDTLHVRWTDEELAALRAGGTLEAFRGLVEPREQVLELVCEGPGWDAAPHAWVTFDPERGRLTFLAFDMTAVTPVAGAAGTTATTWALPRPTVLGATVRP
ncbi:MAG: hypothetical protein U0704_12670 [Candidatus Eisenbacteria bacterium]